MEVCSEGQEAGSMGLTTGGGTWAKVSEQRKKSRSSFLEQARHLAEQQPQGKSGDDPFSLASSPALMPCPCPCP